MNKKFNPNLTRVPECPECGSLNVSTDISTNKIICNQCGYGGKKKEVDFEDKTITILEKEKEKLQAAQRRGERISFTDIEPKKDDPFVPIIPD